MLKCSIWILFRV